MKKLGLIGKNISYSLSPKLHNLIAGSSNFKIMYEIIDVDESELKRYLNLFKEGVYSGFNVTIPYKEKIVDYLDEITSRAKNIGSVNTVYVDEHNRLIGDNTDYYGFKYLLENNNILEDDFKKAYILGKGGAAKTVFYVLKELGYECINVSRNKYKKEIFDEVISYEDFKLIKEVDLLINCTPVGTHPNYESPIKEANQSIKVIIDLIYNPLQTKLMNQGERSINGIDMLIYQAIVAQKIFVKENKDVNFEYEIKEDKETIEKIKEALVNEFVR